MGDFSNRISKHGRQDKDYVHYLAEEKAKDRR
jgi:hypothetical protein